MNKKLLLVLFMFLYLGHLYDVVAQVIYNPSFERTAYEVIHPHIDKVEMKQDVINIHCSLYYDDSWGYNIPKTMYLEDVRNNKRYQIVSCEGLPFEPEERLFSTGGTFQFVFSFPYVKGLETFNLVENSADKRFSERFFDFYGVSLLKSNNIKYEEHEYKRFQRMSDFYKSANDNTKYLEFKKNELESACFLFGTKSRAASFCYKQIAIIYNEMGNYEKALKYDLQSLECDSFYYGVVNKEYPIYAQTLDRISDHYFKLGDNVNYYQLSKKSINVWREIENAEWYSNALLKLRTGYDADGIRKGIEIVQKELDNLPFFIDKESQLLVDVYKTMATRYSILDENKKAIEYCDKVLHIYKIVGDESSLDYAETLVLKCKYLQRNGQNTEALFWGNTAKHMLDSINVKSIKYAELLGSLADLYSLNYDYEKSILLQKGAAEIYKDDKDWISMAGVYNSIAHYYQCAEDLVNAEQYIKNALNLLNDHDVSEYIDVEVERTGNQLTRNPFTLATNMRLYLYTKANVLQTLARIYEKENKMHDAIIKEKEHGDILLSLSDEERYAIHLLTLSGYYYKDKQYEKAINCVEQSLQLYDKDNNLDVALPCYFLSILYKEKDNIEKAIQYAEKSVSNTKNNNNQEIRFGVQPILSHLYWKKGDYKNAELNMSEVLSLLRDTICNDILGMTTEQKQRMWDKFEPNFQFYRNIIEKSERNDTLISKLYNCALFSKSLLLDSELCNDDKELSRLSIYWKDVQQQLSDRDIAIEFISTGSDSIYHTYHALIIDRTCKSPNMITLYNESDLELIRKTSTQSIIDIVGNLIWKPILDQYIDINGIYFSPDGVINILPIEYSNVDGVGEMIDHYNIYRLSSTKEIVFNDQKKIKKNAVLYGGLDYELNGPYGNDDENSNSLWRSINARGGFEPLASTYEEIQDIANLLKSQNVETNLYSGKQGTEDSFKNLSGKQVSMIHLSTHGMYVSPSNLTQRKKENNFDFIEIINNERDPVKEDIVLTHSFLVMSGGNKLARHETIEPGMNDGILTALEISQLDLSKLDLIVLSACETGLGDLDNGGVYGLQRGFKKAGANTILMSLDKVDDEATKILMVEFYKNLMSGKTKLQSLKDAQKYLRQVDKGKYDDPKYWASFIMLDGLN
jgi:CHAT domain-containing protein/tetratricopeptide (TPR) repeat protein